MKNGFTKIPNTLAELPLTIEAIGLYTWLSLRADKDGNVFTSRAKLSKETGLSEQQIRTAIEKLQATKLITKLATKQPTKLATNLTICFLMSYKAKKIESNQVNNQVDNQVSNQPRAYKNDNILSCLTKTIQAPPLIPPRGYEKIDFSFIENDFKRVVFEWLEYKAKKGQKYKDEKSLKLLYKKVINLSNGNPETANAIVEQSMANNWAGIFPLKDSNYGTNQQHHPQANPSDIEMLGQTHRIMQEFRAERLASQG